MVEEAEGYKLFLSTKSATGYMGVFKKGGRFQARRMVDYKEVQLGYYDTAVEAAVAIAKHAAEVEEEEEWEEGYKLFVSKKKSATGYMGVVETPSGRFKAQRRLAARRFTSARMTRREAAVAYAKHAAEKGAGASVEEEQGEEGEEQEKSEEDGGRGDGGGSDRDPSRRGSPAAHASGQCMRQLRGCRQWSDPLPKVQGRHPGERPRLQSDGVPAPAWHQRLVLLLLSLPPRAAERRRAVHAADVPGAQRS